MDRVHPRATFLLPLSFACTRRTSPARAAPRPAEGHALPLSSPLQSEGSGRTWTPSRPRSHSSPCPSRSPAASPSPSAERRHHWRRARARCAGLLDTSPRPRPPPSPPPCRSAPIGLDLVVIRPPTAEIDLASPSSPRRGQAGSSSRPHHLGPSPPRPARVPHSPSSTPPNPQIRGLRHCLLHPSPRARPHGLHRRRPLTVDSHLSALPPPPLHHRRVQRILAQPKRHPVALPLTGAAGSAPAPPSVHATAAASSPPPPASPLHRRRRDLEGQVRRRGRHDPGLPRLQDPVPTRRPVRGNAGRAAPFAPAGGGRRRRGFCRKDPPLVGYFPTVG